MAYERNKSGSELREILAALEYAFSGKGMTFTRVLISQATAGTAEVLKTALTGSYTRLHALFGTLDAAGTVWILDSDAAALTGAMPTAANGGFVIPFEPHPDGCLRSAIDKGLSINTATGKFFGFAIVSQSTIA